MGAGLRYLVFLVVFAVEHIFHRATYFLAHFGSTLAHIFTGFLYIGRRVASGLTYLTALVGSTIFYVFRFVAHGSPTLRSTSFRLVK